MKSSSCSVCMLVIFGSIKVSVLVWLVVWFGLGVFICEVGEFDG